MSRTHKCCVPGCEDSGRAINQPLHSFPDPKKNSELFATWIIAVGGDIVSFDNDYIHRNRKVCRYHFEQKFLCNNNRISKNAVPTLHIPVSRKVALQDKFNIPRHSSGSHSQDIIPDNSQLEPYHVVANKNVNPSNNLEAKKIAQSESSPVSTQVQSQKVSLKSSKEPVYPISIEDHEERELSEKLQSITKKLCKALKRKEIHSNKFKKDIKLLENPIFQKSMAYFSDPAKLFIKLQFREAKKKSKGGRFTDEEKIMSLKLYKQSPKAYRYLRNIFVLPSLTVLMKMHNSTLK